MANWWGHRVEDFVVELLDLDDQVVANLGGVDLASGELEESVAATIRTSGSLTLRYPDAPDIDWTTHRLRVSYQLDDDEPLPLVTAIAKAPDEDHDDTGVTTQLQIFDKTLILDEDTYASTHGRDKGTAIVPAVRDVIASTGDTTSVLIAESSETLAAAMTWDADHTKLGIVNDLLDAGGFFALYADGLGRFRIDDYHDPLSRGVAWEFVDDDRGLYLPAFARTRDVTGVPNRCVCVGRSTDSNTPGLVTIAEDRTGPYGFDRTRRWRTIRYTDVEASSAAVQQAITNRRLATAQAVTETFEITHPVLPFGLNSVVSFTNRRVGTVKAVVQKRTTKLTPGGLVTSTLRRIA